jgi:hypothetical protein
MRAKGAIDDELDAHWVNRQPGVALLSGCTR